jgi:hypothetical protein
MASPPACAFAVITSPAITVTAPGKDHVVPDVAEVVPTAVPLTYTVIVAVLAAESKLLFVHTPLIEAVPTLTGLFTAGAAVQMLLLMGDVVLLPLHADNDVADCEEMNASYAVLVFLYNASFRP